MMMLATHAIYFADLELPLPCRCLALALHSSAYNARSLCLVLQRDAGHGLLVSYILAAIQPHTGPLLDCFFFR